MDQETSTAVATPVETPALLPLTIKDLDADQTKALEELLKTSPNPLTNFEIQRSLFGGNLNKEAAQAIKRSLGKLREDKHVECEGNKRGRRYRWIG